jgi:transcriptional regulator with XRE-family HTH domain
MEQPDLGKELTRIRILKGITQEELALKSKVTIRTIQRIESGAVNPRSYTVRAVSEVLDYDFYTEYETKFKGENLNNELNGENLLVNKIWSKDFFNLKTNTMSKLFILTVILSLGGFGIKSLTNIGVQNVQQLTDNVEKVNMSTSKKVPHDGENMLLQNLNSTYKEIDFIVISENENDVKIQEEIRIYVEKIKNKFSAKTPLIYDTEAIKMDMGKYSFMVYGTIKNNVFLQNFSDFLPIQISDSSIIADKEYKVSNGGAIFNLTNPLNSNEYLVIYAAQQPEGLININSVFHGPTNFVVFNEQKQSLSTGFFKKLENKWVCK